MMPLAGCGLAAPRDSETRSSKVQVTVDLRDAKSARRIIRAIATESHLLILRVLAQGPLTCKEVHVVGPYRAHDYDESTYKALERLTVLGIVRKEYDQKRKRLCYSIHDAGPVQFLQ